MHKKTKYMESGSKIPGERSDLKDFLTYFSSSKSQLSSSSRHEVPYVRYATTCRQVKVSKVTQKIDANS